MNYVLAHSEAKKTSPESMYIKDLKHLDLFTIYKTNYI